MARSLSVHFLQLCTMIHTPLFCFIASDDATQRRYAENFWARVQAVIGVKPQPQP